MIVDYKNGHSPEFWLTKAKDAPENEIAHFITLVLESLLEEIAYRDQDIRKPQAKFIELYICEKCDHVELELNGNCPDCSGKMRCIDFVPRR